ncbi:MAG: ABC transporter permease [Dysgonamonadaceae bacterium]|jgi:putative ABC transport system permease protein|nr:ABC transporter permease [Dysgonamonadaceae bacterium]
MNIFTSHKRTRFFLWVNITGLAIGLAASILLVLFVVNEWTFDKHWANHERIVRLLTVSERDDNVRYIPINLRNAFTELPAKTPGVEAATQLYRLGEIEIAVAEKRFQNAKGLLVDPGFFRVFQLKFVEGTPETALVSENSTVITRRYAEILFGSPQEAMNKTVSSMDREYVVSGVVEELPKNTHFRFDLLASIRSIPLLNEAGGLEFHTYYLIREGVSLEDTRRAIEKEYTELAKIWSERVGSRKTVGLTEMLDDVYLRSKADWGLDKTGSMRFIRLLTALALFILLLAVTNFINLFVTQGETRMNEIGIRKANGAQIKDIVHQFFSEVSLIVLIAFAGGFLLAVAAAPHFGELINKNIDLIQLLNPLFIASVLLLFLLTVVLSAFYPALYLSRFSPLEILGKRLKFSKRRLTAGVVIFQSGLSIILLSVVLFLYKQTVYLEHLPLGYNPKQVMSVVVNKTIAESYRAVGEELLKHPEVKSVSGSQHIFGGGCSGQVIAPWENQEKRMEVNEYRLMTGMPELMELELVEGRFWSESDPDSVYTLIVNEAAARMLGGSPTGKSFLYWERAEVIGVVNDFYYDNPVLSVAPIVLSRVNYPAIINIRFDDKAGMIRAQEIAENVFRQFDPDFVLNPLWNEQIYSGKFKEIKTLTQIVLIASLTSLFIAMLGLLAIHLFSAMRRRKEIGVRRIHGAEAPSIFLLLSLNVLKWIGWAAIVAVPGAVYVISEIQKQYANHLPLEWTLFVLPIIMQCLVALITTAGVNLSVLSQNPVKALKIEN